MHTHIYRIKEERSTERKRKRITRIEADSSRTSANGRRSLLFFPFLGLLLRLPVSRERPRDSGSCPVQLSPFRPVGGAVPFPSGRFSGELFSRDGRKRGRVAGSPIGTGQEARARHGRAATFPIPRADGHRQSETAHEILHGENLRVRAAFPLIATRGNRPFRSRGGTWTVRCNHVHVVSIRQFLPPPPPPPSLFYSILFHRRRVLPFVRLPFYSAIFAPLSLSLFLSWIRSYLMYGTPPSSAGRTLVRLVFDADHSPLSCGSARFPRSNRSLRLYKRARVRGPRIRGENSLSRLDPAGWDLRAYVRTYVACTEENVFTGPPRAPPVVVLSLRRWRAAGLACVELGNCGGTDFVS